MFYLFRSELHIRDQKMAGGVVLVSSSIVRPVNSNQSGRTKIHLTPFDLSLLQFDYAQRGLLFRKPDPDFNLISRLKTSLSLALDIYFPFAGRLVKTQNLEDETVSFHIDCDGSGARFLHAEAESVSVSDFLQPDGSVPDFITNHFFPADDFRSCDGVMVPLLVIQVTEMKDGVFISYCYNHMVADGVSMWGFFHTWSMICSTGSDRFNDHKPLVLKGWFLEGIDYPIHIPVSETERPPRNREKRTKEWVFHFTKENILDLKAKANSEVEYSSDMGTFSSLQAVSAHMWRSIIRHNGVSREQETYCKLVVDLRQRVTPPLEKDSFGNMVYITPAPATAEELLDRGLGWAALQINKLVSSLTNENCQSFAEDWVRNVMNVKSGLGSRVDGDTVVIASSPRFEVYNNDFGWGKPIAVRAGPSNSISGKLTLFPGINKGSIDVQATLWSDVITNLLADVEFLEHVTTA